MASLKLGEVYHEQVQKYFGETAEQQGKRSKFSQREGKLSARLFLLSMVMSVYQYGEIKLHQLAAWAQKIDASCEVTGQAFKERFNRNAVVFMTAMLQAALEIAVPDKEIVVPILAGFKAVYLVDSTVVRLAESLAETYPSCGGAAGQAAAKIYLVLNWLTGKYEQMEITAGRKADQNMGKQLGKDKLSQALWLFDAGFWDLEFLRGLAEQGSYALTRLNNQVAVYIGDKWEKKVRFGLDDFLQLAPRQLSEFKVKVGAEVGLEMRLVLVPVPSEQMPARLRRIREDARRHGKTPSQYILKRAHWNLFVTNAPIEMLPTSTVPTIYRVRWQVELTFKLWKSYGKLAQEKAKNAQRISCQMYAKLIALVLFSRLMSTNEATDKQLSLPKAWEQLKMNLSLWQDFICQPYEQKKLMLLWRSIEPYGQTSRRRRYPSTWDLLTQLAQASPQMMVIDPELYLSQAIESQQLAA